MAKELHWFKFSPLNWMTGRIRKESEKVQIAFIELMCQYWKNGCQMTVEQAELEIGDKIHILIKKKIVKTTDTGIKIDFLIDQMGSIEDTSALRRSAALSRWNAKSSKSNASAMQVHTSAMQNDADKIRGDKIRQEETRKEEILKDWVLWGNQIVNGQDQFWEQMKGRKVSKPEMDEFLSVAARNNWAILEQQQFRISLNGFKVNGTAKPESKNRSKIH